MTTRARLSHLDAAGRACMVDVGDKPVTTRLAVAGATVLMQPATLRLIANGRMPKGDVVAVARLAGIMAAKRTADLIPLCHPLELAHVDVEITPAPVKRGARTRRADRGRLDIAASVRLAGRTGAEMEALTAASVAALTIYDMCKAVDRDIEITAVRLLRKEGGKSGRYVRGAATRRV